MLGAMPGLLWVLGTVSHKPQEVTFQHRGHRFDPHSGKIPHAMGQLSPCATAAEPTL